MKYKRPVTGLAVKKGAIRKMVLELEKGWPPYAMVSHLVKHNILACKVVGEQTTPSLTSNPWMQCSLKICQVQTSSSTETKVFHQALCYHRHISSYFFLLVYPSLWDKCSAHGGYDASGVCLPGMAKEKKPKIYVYQMILLRRFQGPSVVKRILKCAVCTQWDTIWL